MAAEFPRPRPVLGNVLVAHPEFLGANRAAEARAAFGCWVRNVPSIRTERKEQYDALCRHR
ncbi:hypothetical protein [Streptomyces mexicanus]|uniref:hypothetical protein n=1 Tax=Streptomyces mexicanus TaxID=178566 RepID=UPI0031EE44B0